MSALLQVEHISKSFGDTVVLKDVSFSLEEGEVVSIIGSSGSGKTTLLRCLNFLETPDEGVIKVADEVLLDMKDSSTLKESEIRKKRLRFGLVFQNFNLFPQYTALENVMLAKELLAKEKPDYKARKKEIHEEIKNLAEELLRQMGLGDRMNNYPHQLSGDSVSEWRLQEHWHCDLIFYASMNRLLRWTLNLQGKSFALSKSWQISIRR